MRKILIGLTATVAVLGTFLPADATKTATDAATAPRKVRSTCSGTLADWSGFSHGNFGDLTDVDGDPQADVIIVGDSITTATYPELATWLAARGKTLAGNYWSGRPTKPAVDWALSLTTKPKILVMATGTNDIFDPSVMPAQVARMTAWADAEPKTRLIWVDVQAARPGYELCDQRNSGWVNSLIRQGMGAGEVCGWSLGFADNPARIGYYLKPDGVHTITGVGDDYRAAVIGNCIY